MTQRISRMSGARIAVSFRVDVEENDNATKPTLLGVLIIALMWLSACAPPIAKR